MVSCPTNSYLLIMNDFNFFTPTRYIFGKNAQKNVGALSADMLGKRILLVFGK